MDAVRWIVMCHPCRWSGVQNFSVVGWLGCSWLFAKKDKTGQRPNIFSIYSIYNKLFLEAPVKTILIDSAVTFINAKPFAQTANSEGREVNCRTQIPKCANAEKDPWQQQETWSHSGMFFLLSWNRSPLGVVLC